MATKSNTRTRRTRKAESNGKTSVTNVTLPTLPCCGPNGITVPLMPLEIFCGLVMAWDHDGAWTFSSRWETHFSTHKGWIVSYVGEPGDKVEFYRICPIPAGMAVCTIDVPRIENHPTRWIGTVESIEELKRLDKLSYDTINDVMKLLNSVPGECDGDGPDPWTMTSRTYSPDSLERKEIVYGGEVS